MTEPVRIWRLLVAWLVCLPVFTSCIHDDLAGCPQAYSVCFRYDYNMGFTDRFPVRSTAFPFMSSMPAGKYLPARSATEEKPCANPVTVRLCHRPRQIPVGRVGWIERGML